ncbi:MAG: 50S ribosomal protein L11 methyltransferase [Bacteroidia bacterium]|nr:50S ribosomal protein L11 methyltransferase [Bacteroidia bacterium]
MPVYYEYTFKVNPPQPGTDILISDLGDLGFETFTEDEHGFKAYIQEETEPTVNLHNLNYDDFTFTFEKQRIEQTNWNAEWEKNFEPVLVENLLLIRAPFHNPDETVKHEIVIMPKMSFGTGHHDTTWLMCKQLFQINLKNKTVLDMGCGTGVLAILAKKLGALKVVGVDIDEWSVENSIENCANNNCNDIEIKLGSKEALINYKSFDVILANINKNVLKDQMAVYANLLENGGTLLLSGFFNTDITELEQVAENNSLKLIDSFTKNNWAVMKLEKN